MEWNRVDRPKVRARRCGSSSVSCSRSFHVPVPSRFFHVLTFFCRCVCLCCCCCCYRTWAWQSVNTTWLVTQSGPETQALVARNSPSIIRACGPDERVLPRGADKATATWSRAQREFIKARAATRGHLLAVMCNHALLEWYTNFVCHLRDLRLENTHVVFALDQEALRGLRDQKAPVVDFTAGALEQERVGVEKIHGTGAFARFSYVKLRCLLRIAQLGVDVVYSDVDVAIRRDYWSHVNRTLDFQFVSDWRPLSRQHNDLQYLSTGFFFIRASSCSARILAAALRFGELPINTARDDQIAVNVVLHRFWDASAGPRVATFEPHYFPNGFTYFHKHAFDRVGLDPVIVHANYLESTRVKRQRMVLHGLWRVRARNRCSDNHEPLRPAPPAGLEETRGGTKRSWLSVTCVQEQEEEHELARQWAGALERRGSGVHQAYVLSASTGMFSRVFPWVSTRKVQRFEDDLLDVVGTKSRGRRCQAVQSLVLLLAVRSRISCLWSNVATVWTQDPSEWLNRHAAGADLVVANDWLPRAALPAVINVSTLRPAALAARALRMCANPAQHPSTDIVGVAGTSVSQDFAAAGLRTGGGASSAADETLFVSRLKSWMAEKCRDSRPRRMPTPCAQGQISLAWLPELLFAARPTAAHARELGLEPVAIRLQVPPAPLHNVYRAAVEDASVLGIFQQYPSSLWIERWFMAHPSAPRSNLHRDVGPVVDALAHEVDALFPATRRRYFCIVGQQALQSPVAPAALLSVPGTCVHAFVRTCNGLCGGTNSFLRNSIFSNTWQLERVHSSSLVSDAQITDIARAYPFLRCDVIVHSSEAQEHEAQMIEAVLKHLGGPRQLDPACLARGGSIPCVPLLRPRST